MKTMNQTLMELYQKRKITYNDAVGRSSNIAEIEEMIRQAGARAEASGRNLIEKIER
jgi:Tfp pilus assembly ATPase PilU